jgi:diguanylate cyclase (GGDEF)-like protein/PAS domain S-box-containing protein
VIDSGNHGVNSLRLTKVLALLGLLLVTALVTASGIQLPAIPNVVVWHCVLEAWALIATMLVFAVAWCSPLAQSSGGVRVLASGFLVMFGLDFGHTLSYPGMPDFFGPNSVDKARSFQLAGSYAGAFTLLVIGGLALRGKGATHPLLPRRGWPYLVVALSLVTVCYGLIFRNSGQPAPLALPADGSAPIGVAVEVGAAALYLVAAALFYHLQRNHQQSQPTLLAVALLLAASQLVVVAQDRPEHHLELLAHLLKGIALTLLCLALVQRAVVQPVKALKASEEHLRALLNASPDVILELDKRGVCLSVHASQALSINAPLNAIVGRRVQEFLSEDITRKMVDTLDKTGEGRSRFVGPLRVKLKDGWHWFELGVSGKFRMDDQVPRYVVMCRDITQRIVDQERLTRMMMAVEQSPAAIVVVNLHGRVDYVNGAFTSYSGYARDEIVGQTEAVLRSSNASDSVYRDMHAALEQGLPWRGEMLTRRKDGSDAICSVQVFAVRNDGGDIRSYLGIVEDITQVRRNEERIQQLANFDSLTGLPNRKYFLARLQELLSCARRHHQQVALLYLDLDQFKNINDSLGHGAGDAILTELTTRLQTLLGESDILGRQSGDEFALAFADTDAEQATRLAEAILAQVRQTCLVQGNELVTTGSLGIAIYPQDGCDLGTLIQHADTAVFMAKAEGRDSFRFFSPEMQAKASYTLMLENALRTAIDKGRLEIHYQPQVRIADHRIVGVEALLRWRHPQLGYIGPCEFIPIAEASGQIIALGEWVIAQVVEQAGRWVKQGRPDLLVAINLSLAQFRSPGLVDHIRSCLAKAQLSPGNLEFELTETTSISEPERVLPQIQALRGLGVRLALDDFGTGYSSLSQIHRLHVHKIKIDQSFIRDLSDTDSGYSIVKAIVSMSKSMGLTTIAEGVETQDQLEILKALGCDEVQGFYFSRPMSRDSIDALLRGKLALAV